MSDASDDFDMEQALADALKDQQDLDLVSSVDTDDIEEELAAFKIEEAARVAAMTEEERAAYEAQKIRDAEQSKLEEEFEELVKEYKPIMRRNELASTTNRQRQSFARQAFDNRSNPRHDDEFGGSKKRTIRKKNRKGTRTTIRKRQRKNRTRTMRKKARNSRKSNKAR